MPHDRQHLLVNLSIKLVFVMVPKKLIMNKTETEPFLTQFQDLDMTLSRCFTHSLVKICRSPFFTQFHNLDMTAFSCFTHSLVKMCCSPFLAEFHELDMTALSCLSHSLVEIFCAPLLTRQYFL